MCLFFIGLFVAIDILKLSDKTSVKIDTFIQNYEKENGIVHTIEEADFRKLDLIIISKMNLSEIQEELEKIQEDDNSNQNILENKGFYIKKKENDSISKYVLDPSFKIIKENEIYKFTLEDKTEISGEYNIFNVKIFANKDGSLVDKETYEKLSKWNNKETENKIKFYIEDSITIHDLNSNSSNFETYNSNLISFPLLMLLLLRR